MSVKRNVTVPLGRSLMRGGLSQWEPRAQPVAAPGTRPRLELAAVDRDALPHSNEAVTAAAPVPAAVAVVGHEDLHLALPVPDDHAGPARPGVLDRVGQTLLNESVGREVDSGRKRRRRPLDPELDGQARLASLGDEAVEVL